MKITIDLEHKFVKINKPTETVKIYFDSFKNLPEIVRYYCKTTVCPAV